MVRLSVVQVLPALNGGGVERGTLEIARELIQRGHRSVAISAGGRLVPELLREGSEHLTWALGVKSPWTLRWILPLRRWLERAAARYPARSFAVAGLDCVAGVERHGRGNSHRTSLPQCMA